MEISIQLASICLTALASAIDRNIEALNLCKAADANIDVSKLECQTREMKIARRLLQDGVQS